MLELISIAVLWSLCPYKIHVPSQIFSLLLKLNVWSQKLQTSSKLSEWNSEEFFFLTNVCSLIWSIKWRCKQINKKKKFFVTKISFEGMSVCRKCKHYPQGSFALLLSYRDLQIITDFKVILHVPIWVLLILGTQPFFRSNSS